MAGPKKDGGDAPPPASVVRYAPMHNQILPHLRRDIIENRWKSGARLSEPLLCKQFGVSRTPLREALKTLEAEGLVRLVPHVGAVVTDPGATEISETMEILISLEQLAAIRVAQSGRQEVLRDIRRIYAEMRKAARRAPSSRIMSSLAMANPFARRPSFSCHKATLFSSLPEWRLTPMALPTHITPTALASTI